MRVPCLTYGLILAAMCLPLDAYAAGEEHFITDCAGKVEIAHAQVVRVEPNGALILSDGRTVLLEGIRLPLGAPRALSERALTALRAMAQAGPISFTAWSPREDRYGRIRGQGFGRQWLQIALLEQGLAQVAISPDREECAPDLYEAEARGRARHAGIWALAAYRVRAPEEMKGIISSTSAASGSFPP